MKIQDLKPARAACAATAFARLPVEAQPMVSRSKARAALIAVGGRLPGIEAAGQRVHRRPGNRLQKNKAHYGRQKDQGQAMLPRENSMYKAGG